MSKQTKGPHTKFVDLPNVLEQFADTVHQMIFDGQTVKFEFCASRFDEPKPPNPPRIRQYPTCRLVLTPQAAMDLLNKLDNLAKVLEQQGVVKRTANDPPKPQSIQ